MEELRTLVNAGFGRLYASRAEAEADLGGECFPAPMGNIIKLGADGVAKHRLIQDLRRNSVNECAAVPERQVLPRFLDHALDLAAASASSAGPEDWRKKVETLILDFKRAFMTVPVAADELR